MIKSPLIVLLGGRSGSGKTTVANFLKKRFGAEIVSFADPLYGFALSMLECVAPSKWRCELEGNIVSHRVGHAPLYPLIREYLVQQGRTMRALEPNILPRLLAERIRRMQNKAGGASRFQPQYGQDPTRTSPSLFVVPDFRFPNEYLTLLHFQWSLPSRGIGSPRVRTIRLSKLFPLDTTHWTPSDPTETSLDDFAFDATISVLSGKIDMLCAQVECTVHEWLYGEPPSEQGATPQDDGLHRYDHPADLLHGILEKIRAGMLESPDMRPKVNSLVYIAGPFTAPTEEEVRDNVERAIAYGAIAIALGYNVIIPHANTQALAVLPVPSEQWRTMGSEIAIRCNYVVRISGASIGADKEVAAAEREGAYVMPGEGMLANFCRTYGYLFSKEELAWLRHGRG